MKEHGQSDANLRSEQRDELYDSVDAPAGEPDAGGAKPLPQPDAPATQTPARKERRGTARHEIDSFASILLVNVGSKLRGRILDLSLGGCRIRTDQRFPVGIYTRVETEFKLDGLPFRLGGVIQAIHDHYTVGIRFLDLSDRKRGQVLELIGELDELCATRDPVVAGAAEPH